ncbi:hypothetical protein DdX_17243 [Ditylenchus destructor]|uniref:Uncharacterized protein n=1 Tax=Ditylenchus destructor TaxID=166010 RepID=A0AAD4QVY8_9BILA|nr:hypothetical protein DdX_17243 [Ditylenchus destructor]
MEKDEPSVRPRLIAESELPQMLANCNLDPDNPMTPLLTAFASIITQQENLLKYMSGQVHDLKRLTTRTLSSIDASGSKIDTYSHVKTYVLQISDISEIYKMDTFHNHGEENYRYGEKMIIFVDSEENVQRD